MHRVLIIGILLAFTSGIPAQILQELDFEHISAEQGLSQITVYTVFQDEEGFLWFGTQDGLNRYDGYELRVYRHRPFDSSSLSHNWIYCITEDPGGNLWIGTRNGLNIYRRGQDKFERFSVPGVFEQQDVQNICRDFDGSLWFNSSRGLYHHQIADSSLRYYRFEQDLKSEELNCFYLDRQDNLWLGSDQGLIRYNRTEDNFTDYGFPERISAVAFNDIAQDSSGMLWIASDRGLHCFDPGTNQYVNDLPEASSEWNINAIIIDKNDLIWLGNNDGFIGLDPENGTFSTHSHDDSRQTSLSDNTIFSMYQDRSSLIWIGTYGGGINKLNLKKNVFKNIRKSRAGRNGLQDNFVYAIAEDTDGSVLVGTDEGIDIFYPDKAIIRPFNAVHSPGLRLLRTLVLDHAGTLWVGTVMNGLYAIDNWGRGGMQLTHLSTDPETGRGIGSNSIMRILEDSDNTIWIGTTGGLYRLQDKNRSRRQFEVFRSSDDARTGPPVNHIRALCEGQDGKIWIGTFGGGICSFDRRTEKFRHYRHQPENPKSLSSNYIYSILQDHSGAVWAGSYGGGLNRFNPDSSDNGFQHFYIEDGLPGNLIYGIVEDHRENIWISTNNGLAKLTYNPDAQSESAGRIAIRPFDVSDGIQNNEFNFGAYFTSSSDLLYFGGISGLTYFDPDEITEREFTPPVVLTDFRIFNQSVKAGPGTVLPVNITEADQIGLLYRQNVFTFEFAALDFTAPFKNRYAYKMEGFDTDWTTVTARDRSVTYTNLDPGNYIFKLRGTNSDGIWSPAEKSVTVTINPPFWLTWWFRLLWASVLTGSVFYIYRLRIRRIKKQNMILEERIEQRTRELREKTHQLEITNEELESFAYSVSHDLRSPLRAISGYSSMIMEEYAEKIENKEIREYLHRIKSGSHQMSDLIDAILKLTRLTRGNLSKSNVNLSDLAREIIDRLKERDPGRRVRIVIGKDLTAWGDPTLLRTMLQNLLENAWKFTQNTQKPVIKFARMNKTGELAEKNTFFIQDNGTGFDMHYSDKLFQPFQRLHTASEYPGTGIGLATVKRIINRHGGTIWVDSIPATKTIFYFTLPDKTIQLY